MESLAEVKSSVFGNIQSGNIIAGIVPDFSVQYFREGFTKRYKINNEKLLALNNCSDRDNYQIHLLLCKLRHVHNIVLEVYL